LKALASKLGLIPRSLGGRELLKRLFFGVMTTMPRTLADTPFLYKPPVPINGDLPDRRHKILYCFATLNQKG
jgi:hypothetical protein